jgi:tetratricopeptide (TPR) repeat protein
VYEKERKSDKAITAYEKVLEIEPQNALAHFNLGCVHANRGEIKKARQYWQETLRIDPNYEKAKQYLKVTNH